MHPHATMLGGLIPLEFNPAAISAPFTHDNALVGASMLVAVATAFAYLELAGAGRGKRGAARWAWFAAAGAMLGLGVWATHFVGLIAFETPLMHGMALEPTLLSAIAGVATGCIAFMLAGRHPDWRTLTLAGACVGLGGIVMHYLGMQGLRIEASLSYQPLPVVATTLGAFAGAIAAFFLAHRIDTWQMRAVWAFPMGAVTAGLHYTDMAATIVTPRPAFALPQPDADATALVIVLLAVCLCVAAAFVLTALDRRAPARGPAQMEEDDHIVIIPNPKQRADTDTIVILPRPEPQPRDKRA